MQEINSYFSIAQAIALLFYPHAEVVIHDLRSKRIAAIFNPFSKRKVGDESLLDDIKDLSELPDVFPLYFQTNWDGRKLKSVTATLRDQNGRPFGLLCINVDLSKWEELHHFVLEWMGGVPNEQKPNFLFKEDYREKINLYVAAYLKQKGVTLKTLSKEKKQELVKSLHREGAFDAKNAANYVADVLDVSRATIYNYLRLS